MHVKLFISDIGILTVLRSIECHVKSMSHKNNQDTILFPFYFFYMLNDTKVRYPYLITFLQLIVFFSVI